MSTRELEVLDAETESRPSTSMALVPLPRGPVPQAQTAQPETAHRWFYGSGYTGLVLILCAAATSPANELLSAALLMLGACAVGLGGLGVFIHVLYRPRMDKLRKGLGAVASVALTAAAAFPLYNAALEVHASKRVLQLQPLAELVSGIDGVRVMGRPDDGWVELNGFRGDLHSSATVAMPEGSAMTLAQVLERDGISRLELVRLRAGMETAGVSRIEAEAAYIAFAERGDADLLYVRPGQALPQPGTTILESTRWRTRPLGGGWYLLVW